MVWDVVYVTYNSEKWIKACFASWKNRPVSHEFNIIVVDNASTDNTVQLLESVAQETEGYFAGFRIIKLTENVGFGAANNIGFRHGDAEIICFFNIDTELLDGTIANLAEAVRDSQEWAGVWELRQIPYEHPKIYDPVTLETDWCSGAAFAVRRTVYEEAGGFDEQFFMYAEDVDLSWRVRQKGHHILYCPNAMICHKSYVSKGEIKFTQYAYSMRNNLLMRYRYGSLGDIVSGYLLFLKLLIKNGRGLSFNRRFIAVVNTHWRLALRVRKSRIRNGVGVYFSGLNYSPMRGGSFYEYKPAVRPARIVVFVQGSENSDLQEYMQCIKRQTYQASAIYRIGDIEEIAEIRKGMETDEDVWFSVMDPGTRVYADHFETLVGGMKENCEAVGSVNEEGELPEHMEYYMVRPDFYERNKARGLEKLCKETAVCIKKQTVCSKEII